MKNDAKKLEKRKKKSHNLRIRLRLKDNAVYPSINIYRSFNRAGVT